MKKTKNDIYLEEEAEKIQQLSLKQWKTVAKNRIFLLEHKQEIPTETEALETEKEQVSEYLQKLSLRSLRNLPTTEHLLVTPTLAEKATITGLPQEVIQKLETQKEKATLEEIITYCSRLHIPFQAFLPELFVPFINLHSKA